jgi:alpha-galactosidase
MPTITQSRSIQAGSYEITLEKEPDSFEVSLNWIQQAEGLDLIQLKLSSPTLAVPGVYRLSWRQPLVDIQGFWRPGNDQGRTLPADWSEGFVSQSTTHAPVGCLYNLNGQNRHTWAFSDALNPIEILAGVHEETAVFRFSLTLFKACAPFKEYAATLRLDTRSQPYFFESLNEVQAWWAAQPGYYPAPVPAAARQPMYSTWYSFHQRLEAAAIEEQCRLAHRVGCEAVIVDDGWQTSNNDRGYAYCGDWQVWAEKIPDMAAHVARVHALGLKYILWYALPFVGPHSRIFSRFEGKYLAYLENHQTWVLDPRFPDVREYLINIYETTMRDWGVDGFKLDFVQHFKQPPGEDLLTGPAEPTLEALNRAGRDYTSVPEAADRLLADLLERLRRLNPDVLIEFRQPYIGPLMRKYGNMFRAGDCPNDSLLNRLKTLDVRLLAGNSATHADMLMWHGGEPPESAALQLINVLFAVPQISVCWEKLPVEHHRMLEFWLAFWTRHKELLLDGELKPWHPELGYTEVEALNNGEQLMAVYARVISRPSLPLRQKITLVNGTLEEGVVLDCREAVGRCRLKIQNCMGEVLSNQEIDFTAGLIAVAVPPAGVAVIDRKVSP